MGRLSSLGRALLQPLLWVVKVPFAITDFSCLIGEVRQVLS